jgi:hypothetical protein
MIDLAKFGLTITYRTSSDISHAANIMTAVWSQTLAVRAWRYLTIRLKSF